MEVGDRAIPIVLYRTTRADRTLSAPCYNDAMLRISLSTLDDFVTIVRGAMAKTGIDKCDTVDVLVANETRKKTE